MNDRQERTNVDIPTTTDLLTGFRGTEACQHAGITYRQLDYWDRTGLVTPSLRPAQGSGTSRLYSRTDVIDLALVKVLLDIGASLTLVRSVLPEVHRIREAESPATVTVRDPRDPREVVTITIDLDKLAATIPDPPRPEDREPPTAPVVPILSVVP